MCGIGSLGRGPRKQVSKKWTKKRFSGLHLEYPYAEKMHFGEQFRIVFKPPAAREARKAGVIVFLVQKICVYICLFSFFFVSRYRMKTQWMELKFSLKLPQMPLHQASSGELDTIRIRATPIRFRRFRPNH